MTDALPGQGRDPQQILEELAQFGDRDPAYKQGRLWSLVYYLDEPFQAFLGQAYQQFVSANGLNPTAFKSLKQFENEIIATRGSIERRRTKSAVRIAVSAMSSAVGSMLTVVSAKK